jgi:regulation of enolase protein 1 (concanavalin A-like superfamily)
MGMSTQSKFWIHVATLALPSLTVIPSAAEPTPAPMAVAAGQRPIRIPGVPKAAQWVNPPAAFAITHQGLDIVASEGTDKYIAADGSFLTDSANRLLFAADPDFILSASISQPFDNKWDAGGLILEGDAENWIKFCFEKDYTGAHRVVSVVTKGTSDDSNSIAFDARGAYFQMAKIGDVVFLYVSRTGRDWYLVRVVNFKFDGKLQIGFLAQTPEGKSNRVAFRQIKYSPTAMKDFWKGE